ncbi:MAG: mercury methylation ferredoxin HgcB [Syntrophobacteraceae bacterium]
MSKLVYLKEVVTLKLDGEACSGCAMCTTVCPRGVFEMSRGKARIADRDSCIECGACARNCPESAVSVQVGVGCASAVINSAFGRSSGCSCSVDQYKGGCC